MVSIPLKGILTQILDTREKLRTLRHMIRP